jgi:D-alanyl-lipoteichoic acid acyltransferase DltB (MBOAT superfamily)
MLFPTFAFGLFFVVVFVLNWLTRPHPTVWRAVIFGSSVFFYGWWNWRFVILLLWAIGSNWFVGNKISRCRLLGAQDGVRAWTSIAIASDLTLLGVFKYYDFFAVELSNLLGMGNAIPILELTLPVGISFFTFQAMSYVIDLRRGVIEPMKFLDFAVYLSFFPQLVAGPIVRASEMAPQIAKRSDPRRVASAEAFHLILRGLFKKVVVSSWLASNLVDGVFADPQGHSSLDVLFGVYGYAIQIYADFSGYTDIAIGVALLLGFRFPINFDRPYSALSLRDFWRRWHITLSSWLRDYLYIPLGGNRGQSSDMYRNLLITMLLGGLWHGSTWNFVIWGAIHGVALIVERSLPTERIHPVIRWALTFHVVCFAWIFFRADSVSAASDVLSAIIGSSGDAKVLNAGLIFLVLASIGVQFVTKSASARMGSWMNRRPVLIQGIAFGIGLVVIDTFGPEGIAPFIYFQF